MGPTSTSVGPRPDQIIESLTTIVSKSEGEIVFVTCVNEDGYVGDSEAFASTDKPRSSLPMKLLFSCSSAMGSTGGK